MFIHIWKIGRVKETHPGNDGIVQMVSVKTASGILMRSMVKLLILPTKKTKCIKIINRISLTQTLHTYTTPYTKLFHAHPQLKRGKCCQCVAEGGGRNVEAGNITGPGPMKIYILQ